MTEKLGWFPIDTRILPFDFSFKRPRSPWVRLALATEFILAFVSVVGTLLLVALPQPKIPPVEIQATTPAPTTPPGPR